MRKTLIISIFFGLVISGYSQKQIKKYEYWYDENYLNKTSNSVISDSSIDLTTNMSTGNLFEGLHTFNIRFQDNKGVWSVPINQFFIKTPLKLNRSIKLYEYWFDTYYEKRVSLPIAALNESLSLAQLINVDNLPDGLHVLNIRFQDMEGAWSSPVIQFFVKTENIGGNKIKGYRYWFNQDYTKLHTVEVSPVNPLVLNNIISIPSGSLKVSTTNYEFYPNAVTGHKIVYNGQTYFNIQFKDKKNSWSKACVDPVNTAFSVNAKCDTIHSDIPVVKNLPQSDTLHFYVAKVNLGDSLILSSDKSLTVDVYDPTGIKTIANAALISSTGSRFRAKLNGDYYFLVHGFNVSLTGSYTLNYNLVPKCSVSGYNKKIVGNKAPTTIVFTGNGFSGNTKIILTSGSNSISTTSLTSQNGNLINATFDFTDAPVGLYDINVNFGDTMIIIKNGLEVNTQTYTVLSGNISMNSKGNYEFAGVYEYDNLELADNANLLSSGISQLVIKVNHTLTIGKNVSIRVRNGYYSGSPLHSTTLVTKDNVNELSVFKGDGYSLYSSTFGRGGNGGDGGSGGYGDYQVRDIAYNIPEYFPGLGGGGGGGGAGGFGGGIGGAGGFGGGHSETSNTGKGYDGKVGITGNNNGNSGGSGGPGGYFTAYIYSSGGLGGGATSVGSTTSYAGGNNANGGGGGGGNGANGTMGGARMLGDYYSMYNGDGGGGGGAGGYGGGVLVITANKIEYDSLSIPDFIALGQNGGYGGSGGQGSTNGTNASNGSNGTNGESGLIIINTPNQIPQFTYIANRLGSNTSPLPGGHGIVSGIATVLYNVDNLNTVIENICDDNINNFALYPNPTTDFFKISGVKSTAIVKLYNLEGREVLSKEITNDEFIRINFLSKGLYMVKVFSQDGIQVMKVMKN